MDPVTDSPEEPAKEIAMPRSLFYLGSAGLLTVMIVEAIAVVGRHIRYPLLGALEIVQAAIVPTACAAMVITTLCQAHAVVHLLLDRLPQPARGWTRRAGWFAAGVLFAALCTGEVWLTSDFWNSFEETDVLRIPLQPLRILVTVTAGLLAAVFFHRAARADRA
jgi:TRAP-type C4-dicarboxylate transport system permease small subunit